MFRFPYRWLPCTLWPNIRSGYYDITNGIKNLWRWVPVIWFDSDDDWEYLATIMERKFTWMAEYEQRYGHHVGSKRDAHRMRVCATLLRRMMNEHEKPNGYYAMAQRIPWGDADVFRHGKWQGAVWARHIGELGEQDCQYLGRLLGKYLRGWWD